MSVTDRLEEIRRLIGYILLNYPLSISEMVRLEEALLKLELVMESMSGKNYNDR